MQCICQAPNCPRGGEPFESIKAAKTCSPRCRKRLQRAPKNGAAPAVPSTQDAKIIGLPTNPAPTPPAPPAGGVYTPPPFSLAVATLEALTKADRVDTPLGRNVLLIAARLDNATGETFAGIAALEKSFRAAYADAMAGADGDEDELDGIERDVFQVIAGGRV